MRQQNIQQALSIVCGMYADHAGAALRFGHAAYTDFNQIVIPWLGTESKLYSPMVGYVGHEAAHILYTSREKLSDTPFHHQLVNLLEDPRIERLFLQDFPGWVRYLLSMNHHCGFGETLTIEEMETKPPQALYQQYLAALAVQLVPAGYSMMDPDFIQNAEPILTEHFGEAVVARTIGLMTRHKDCKDTVDVARLASRIVEMLVDEKEKQEERAQQEQQDQSQDGDSSDSGESGETGKSGESGESGDSDDSGEAGPQTTDGKGAGGQACADALQELLESQDGIPDKADLMRQQMQQEVAEQPESEPAMVSSRPINRMTTRQVANSGLAYHDLQAASVSSGLRSHLQRVLEAETRARRTVGKKGQRIKGSKIPKFVTQGDVNIFRTKVQKKMPDTAVQLLVDLSGSMQGQEEALAKQAMYALMMAMQPLRGVTLGVGAFTGNSYVQVLKHGEPVGRNRIAAVSSGGGTPMGEAMFCATKELAEARKERHILVVITDGQPDDAGSVALMNAQLRQCGVEVIGIGIHADTSRLYPESIRINNVSDLSRELLGIVSEKLKVQLR